jgi:flagellar biogenesis protein FliO
MKETIINIIIGAVGFGVGFVVCFIWMVQKIGKDRVPSNKFEP